MPLPVLERAAKEMTCYASSGMSVMEMSHRSSMYLEIFQETEAVFRELMKVPENYSVLFLQGGATAQFAAGGKSTPVLLALLAVLALLAAPFLWYLGRRQRWKKQLGGERNKAAISIWRCAKRICSFGGNMPPVIAQNAQRAFYGRGLESANELKAGRQALEQLREAA